MNIELDNEPIYGDNDKYMKAKIKMYEDRVNRVNTNFQGKKVSKENASDKCLSLMTLNSVIRTNKKCYPQALLEEYTHVTRKRKWKTLLMMI